MIRRCRKRIALLVGQPEEYSQSQFITGFLERSFALDYDVLVFSMYIKYQSSTAKEIGESSIYSLVSYDKFDAVVVMADTIQTPNVVERIEEELHNKFSGPVIFVDRESKYFLSTKIDTYNPQKKVISHLIDVHGLKDISFLSGKAWHPQSISRVNAYKDTMEEHGFEVDEDNIYYGDFWYDSGESLADDLTSGRKKMPRAIACANDCMAIGLARRLIQKGVKVPEDVCVVGFDTNDEGKHTPVPVTSAPIPYKEHGNHTASMIDNLINGRCCDRFEANVDLFVGGTCGCGCDSAKPYYPINPSWELSSNTESIFSLFNHMEDDLLEQASLTGVLGIIFSNVNQLRSFESFDLCLNPQREAFEPGKFESQVLHAISCGPDGANKDKISFNEYFPTTEMLPGIYEPRVNPSAFFFLPLYFGDRIFGYTAIGYGNDPKCIGGEYRAWNKSISRALEYYRRGDDLIRSSQIAENGVLNDTLTGLYNYRGFISASENFLSLIHNNGGYVSILATDIKELSKINHTYGRSQGDKAIVAVSSLIKSSFSSRNCLCVCVGNGELIAIKITRSEDESEMVLDKNNLLAKIEEYNRSNENEYNIDIYYGIVHGSPKSVADLENLLNTAVSLKNNLKLEAQKVLVEDTLTEEEQEKAKVVQDILNDNKIAYHFQPIVSASTGDIYAYEALMRAQVSPYLTPPVVLYYADFFGRLYDIEKSTFSNVLRVMKDNKQLFEKGRKVFVNSIPGHRLKGKDLENLEKAMGRLPGSVVVELTEQTEMEESELKEMKEAYSRIGIETALDDYGTGYSNVSNLLRYMPGYVKIDRELISGIENSPQKQHFVREIIEYSHSNKIIALAEGVETSDELKTVIELGADLIQGYYTARPQAGFAEAINPDIKAEIVKFSTGKSNLTENRIYVAGKEEVIDLVKLSNDKISHVLVGDPNADYKNLTILGTPGEHASLDILFGNEYKGTVVFENVDIGKKEGNVPSIIITENADVVIELKGLNTLNGGIRVDKDSSIDIEGEGYMSINVTGSEYYGIGNTIAADSGKIILNQNGTLTINGKGDIGVGIGAGGDTDIDIRRGSFIMSLRGDMAAAMGSINGDAEVRITNCAVDMDSGVKIGVGAGSVYGETNIYTRNLGYKGIFKGDNITAFGTVDGKICKVDIRDAGINLGIRAENSCCIGSSGDLCQNILIYRENVRLSPKLNGVRKIEMGNARGTARIEIIGD